MVVKGKSPLEEYLKSCSDSLLKRTIQVYAQHKYEGKEGVVSHLATLFATVLEERLNAEDDN
jgi:hypothetical protein